MKPALLAAALLLLGMIVPGQNARADNSPAALKARSEALDKKLGTEMRRLQQYLGYEDQILGMQVAQGTLTADAAAARLAQETDRLYRKSYPERELQAKIAEHRQAAAEFFQKIQAQADPTAAAELQKVQAQFAQPSPNSASYAPLLARAAEILASAKGQTSLPTAQNPFSGSGERVIGAITSRHGHFLASLAQSPQPPEAAPGRARPPGAPVGRGGPSGPALPQQAR